MSKAYSTSMTLRERLRNSWVYDVAGFLSVECWGRLSDSAQITISTLISKLYETKFSRFFIRPYCYWQYRDVNYPNRFKPGSGGETFRSFQDFFTRDFAEPPHITAEEVWPCEGYLCEQGAAHEIGVVHVKGEPRSIETVFGVEKSSIPENHFFSNVFLHNNNYHHIHAPVQGTITRIQHVPGALLLLRPWAYKKNPSLPALTNERYNVDIEDVRGRKWLLSIVGGPLVATIKMAEAIGVGSHVAAGQKIASFAMGSTCCMVSPIAPGATVGEMVNIGHSLTGRTHADSHVTTDRLLCHG